nr:DUF4258 domain-containing protein [Kaistia hirudinis]
MAANTKLKLTSTEHARDQMSERDLIMGDVLYVLKHGFVLEEAQASTQASVFKYLPQSRTPNSGNRTVRVVVVVDAARLWMKLITVMWVDE